MTNIKLEAMKKKIEDILDEGRFNGLPIHIVAEQLFDLYNVSNQRELLIAFFESVDAEDLEQHRNGKGWKVVDNYLKAINDC